LNSLEIKHLVSRICVSIAPIDAMAIRTRANRAIALGADFVEIRFDALQAEDLPQALEAAEAIKDRAIFTFRSSSQGGRFSISERDRIDWLLKLSDLKPLLLDVELDTLKDNDELVDSLEKQNARVLVSWHDFRGTPSRNKIADLLSDMRTYSSYVKVVTTARVIDDALRLLEMYHETSPGLYPIFFAMGEAGVISRILCTLIGNAPFTYATLDKPIAPGQLTLQQMKKLYDLFNHEKV
jgi:3-dehydroquinate dehydratase-1